MRVKHETGGREMRVAFEGELDHHAAKKAIRELGEIIDVKLPLKCELDLERLDFMDSSGIAVILSLYRRLYEIGGELVVLNVPTQALKVLLAAGVDKIVNLAKPVAV